MIEQYDQERGCPYGDEPRSRQRDEMWIVGRRHLLDGRCVAHCRGDGHLTASNEFVVARVRRGFAVVSKQIGYKPTHCRVLSRRGGGSTNKQARSARA